jgi:hypothetical protein
MATTAQDLITGALRRINVYAPGESLDSADSSDALTILNDLLDSWSSEHLLVFASDENLFTLTGGQYKYTIGNYAAGTFAGTVTNGSPTITGASVPANMVARGDLTGSGIPAGTTILSFNSGAGTITMSANATASPGAQQIAYTIPGDLKMIRPTRVNSAFTRITSSGTSSLDYTMTSITTDQYASIGLKTLPGPWAKYFAYNETFPLGTLYLYPNPQSAGELHLWTDDLLQTFASLTTQVSLPPGYVRALKLNLAVELAPEYGKTISPVLAAMAKEAKDLVKGLNQVPQGTASFDMDLVRSPRQDAGWILHGGFNQ